MSTNILLYTDGACSGNPGPGGWAAILKHGGYEKELCGGAAETTNNRMELTAVIEGLAALKKRCSVTAFTDSKYIADGMNKGWAKNWRARNWIKPDRQPALNPDLWQRLLDLCEQHSVTFIWVRGHAGNEYNERCDALAVGQSMKYKAQSADGDALQGAT